MLGENGQISPSTSVRAARRAGSRLHLAAVLQEGRKYANIHARSGIISGSRINTSLPSEAEAHMSIVRSTARTSETPLSYVILTPFGQPWGRLFLGSRSLRAWPANEAKW